MEGTPEHDALQSGAVAHAGAEALPQSRSQVQLRYSLGDLCLFRARFDAVVTRQPFDPGASPLSSFSEEAQLPAGVSVRVQSGSLVAGPVSRLRATRRAIRYVRNQTVNHYVDLSGT